MLEFKPLEKDCKKLKKYFEKSKISFCDISVGSKFMWRDLFRIDYAIFNDTLILKESTKEYSNAFYYPMGEDIDGAFLEIERYCATNKMPLTFCCIDNKMVIEIFNRYPFSIVTNDRNWSDYIYDAEKFCTYSGKHYSGQRNHVNKFKKLYPTYCFHKMENSDIPRILDFVSDYKKETEITDWTAIEEANKINELIENSVNLGQLGGYIEVDDKIVAFSLGEIVGDTLIAHIEKGLREYEGVYPTMAQEFAKAFVNKDIKFINREEDCGDMGLRISKLQYHPIEVKEKNFIRVGTAFDKIKEPYIKTDRLYLFDIREKDKQNYFELCSDINLNKYFGYDYREDLNGEPSCQYFFDFQKGLKEKKEEYDLGVYLNDNLIGEVCLYNFDIYGTVEIGFRFLKEFWGKGYATESVNALTNYAKNELKAVKIKARVFKENEKSLSLLQKCEFKKIKEDEEFLYFIK